MTDRTEPSNHGRPYLPTEQRRSERVVMMVTADEYAALQDLSAESGNSISTTCRDLLRHALAPSGTGTQTSL